MTDPLPVRRRRAARVLLFDGDQRLLLIHDSDQGLPGRPDFWITPGGGLDPGEDWTAAALRELFEETGLALEQAALLGPVWHRPLVVHTFSDHRGEQEEVYFLARAESFDPVPGGLTEAERETVLGTRWWSPAELAGTDDDIWPRELRALLPPLVAALPSGLPPALVELPETVENPGDPGSPPRAGVAQAWLP